MTGFDRKRRIRFLVTADQGILPFSVSAGALRLDAHSLRVFQSCVADTVTPQVRSRIMARVRQEDTVPEIVVRRMLHAAGLRFRLHRRDLPGKPDIVLTRHRTVVFVHGCFWHGHSCKWGRRPSSNTDFWNAKIDKNIERDEHHLIQLQRLGWRVRVIWSCELHGEAGRLIDDLLNSAGRIEPRPRSIDRPHYAPRDRFRE